jgi:HSP20 family protein
MWTKERDINRMFGAMDLLRSRMNRVFPDFERWYGTDYAWTGREGYPLTNLYDTGDHLELCAEVPGLEKDDINIRIQGNYLEINGTRKSDAPEGYQAHRVERGTASFSRSFTLPSDVDADRAEAGLKNGVLTLKLPKAEAAKPRKITIS